MHTLSMSGNTVSRELSMFHIIVNSCTYISLYKYVFVAEITDGSLLVVCVIKLCMHTGYWGFQGANDDPFFC